MVQPTYDRNALIELLRAEALKVGEFTLSSGRRSHYYVDGRRVTLSSRGAHLIGAGVLERLAGWPEVEAVGGLTLGADPVVASTLTLAGLTASRDLSGFLVRKQAKEHGTGRRVEGPVRPGQVVAVLDDVATTGGSSLEAVEQVEALSARVAVVIVVLDRLEGAAQAFEQRKLPFESLLTIRDLGVEPLPPLDA